MAMCLCNNNELAIVNNYWEWQMYRKIGCLIKFVVEGLIDWKDTGTMCRSDMA